MSKLLSSDDVQRFQKEGYLSPIRVMSEAEAADVRKRLEEFEARTGGPLRGDLRHKAHLLFPWLADLVRKEACADVARAIELGAAIRLGASEVNAGGRSRTAILADVCEALIGAVFIDGGYPAASALIERLWSERMRTPARPLRDSKTMLQEWAQARGLPTPAYREVERKGPDHDPEFRVTVELPDLAPAEGLGRSKRSIQPLTLGRPARRPRTGARSPRQKRASGGAAAPSNSKSASDIVSRIPLYSSRRSPIFRR